MFRYNYDAKLKLVPLNPDALSNEPVLIKCQHDNKLEIYHAKITEQIIVISFLNFTVFDIAAQLATNNQCILSPEVIFVDNSQLAEKFWLVFREFMQEAHVDFKAELKKLLIKNANLICPENFSTEQKDYYLKDSLLYIVSLFEKYDFKYFSNLIFNAKFIRQTWSSIKTFSDLRAYLLKNEYDFTFVFNGTKLVPSSEHPSFNLTPLSALRRQLQPIAEVEEKEKEEKGNRHISFSPLPRS